MKLNRIIGGFALMALAATASADQTIEITGATAFRTAAVKSIVALYGSGLNAIAHNNTSTASNGHEGANDVIFRGTISGCPGVTTIRCSWSGSVEGLNAIHGAAELYLPATAYTDGTGSTYAGPATGVGAINRAAVTTTQVSSTQSKISFSDVFATSTPYDVPAQDAIVGIQPFFALINDGAPAEFTNMQAQKFGQLLDGGFLPASFLFGLVSPTTERNVYLTGRNDGSGTRTTYVAISRGGNTPGFGRNRIEKGEIGSLINQFRPDAPVSDAISELRRWPTGDGASASTVWGPDAAGNGGFSSGSSVAARLAAKSATVQIKTAAGGNSGSPTTVNFVGVLGLGDTITAQTGGARVLAWDGASITVTNPLAATEEAKIKNGIYPLWSYEHMFANSLTDCEQGIYDALLSGIPANLAGAGIDPSLMNVGRVDDGTDVTPL